MDDILLIGDVHGKVDQYKKIINYHKGRSIQIGDFGFKVEHDWHLNNVDSFQHHILFGNHDYYPYLKRNHSLRNFSFINFGQIMTLRGAFSIDKMCRKEGRDWFNNEELTYNEMQYAISHYLRNKPRIVISHDCPHEVRQYLFNIHDKSITSNGLQIMFEDHQPDIWIFGHHHMSKSETINGTRFICLAELETFII